MKIETMYDLKVLLNGISDYDLKNLGIGFSGDDGQTALVTMIGDDECDKRVFHLFNKKRVALLSEYFNKIVEGAQIEDGYDWYGENFITSDTKFNKHNKA
jgi:hypothetical protein